MGGDTMAMKIIADRIWPPRKGRPVRLDFPENLDPFESLRVVVKGMADGVISPEEAASVTTTLMAQARLADTHGGRPGEMRSRVVIYLPANGRGDAGFPSSDPDPAAPGPQEAVQHPDPVWRSPGGYLGTAFAPPDRRYGAF